MINLKRTTHTQQRDHTHYCQHHCALCKNPCEKQGRYPSLPGSHPPIPVPVVGQPVVATPANGDD